VLPLKGLDGRPTASTLVLGQVVGVHIAPAYLRGGLFDLGLHAPRLDPPTQSY
jgi:hypothetical protein